ncbi:MAG: Uma2 family endonuclease [Polyangiaceae bacterium]
MPETALRNATYEDLLALPAHVVGQIVCGVLHATPRPAPPHARASTTLGEELGPPFNRGRGGPGGWVILDEPELHLGAHVLVPDLAGWRRERLPELPIDKAYFELAPDWVCEVLSPSTAALDRGDKRRVYAEHQVRHLWFVDPEAQVLEVFALDGESYRLLEVYSGDQQVRAVPFDAIEMELGALWAR